MDLFVSIHHSSTNGTGFRNERVWNSVVFSLGKTTRYKIIKGANMPVYKAYSPTTEINGKTVLTVVKGLGAFQSLGFHLLEKYGIKNPVTDAWYLQQSWLKVLKEIETWVGKATLKQIGKIIPENADFPADIDSIRSALKAIDTAYHQNHRNGEVGHYTYLPMEERTVVMVCNNPYPCPFDEGLIEAMANKFKPESVKYVRVTHSDKTICRMKGGDECTYIVSW